MAADPIIFTVPGEAKAWARAGSNKGRKFTPRAQDTFANLLKDRAEAAMAGRLPLTCACELTVTVRRALPASPSRPKRAAMLAGAILPTAKPDADNHAKIVGDALNGICWRDDALICRLVVEKIYAEIPGVTVSIRPMGAGA